MLNYSNIKFDLTDFFKGVHLKKNYIKTLDKKIFSLNSIKYKSYKNLSKNLINFYKNDAQNQTSDNRIMYIMDLQFSRSNTLLHIMDFKGNLKFFCSAGSFNYKGKRKLNRFRIVKHFLHQLVSKLNFLEGKPIALHLNNVGSNKFWIVKQFKTKFYIKLVKTFNQTAHNGCRKKKVRRKKFKIKKR